MATDHRLSIVHVTGDFPDPFNASKTPVIRSHLELTKDRFDHRVVSLNRVAPGLRSSLKLIAPFQSGLKLLVKSAPFEFGEYVTYAAPAHGMLHATMLRRLGDWLARELEAGQRPDLLVAHKLTIEGIVVRRAAMRLGLPYAVSVQGNTDTRIMRVRPDLQSEFSRIYHDAGYVFPFAPWTKKAADQRLGRRERDIACLPCPTELDNAAEPKAPGSGFVSVFHLWNYRQKNLPGMIEACRILEARGRAISLDVVGGGNRQTLKKCKDLVGGIAGVRFVGAKGRHEVQARMNAGIALLLPSLRESFGLVFVEALFAGTPIIYPAGTAVDGYFDDLPFAIRVDPKDPQSIASAMERAIDEEDRLKASLADWQSSADALRFRRAAIADLFTKGLLVAARSDPVGQAAAQ